MIAEYFFSVYLVVGLDSARGAGCGAFLVKWQTSRPALEWLDFVGRSAKIFFNIIYINTYYYLFSSLEKKSR
jgi:hypothetical protein